MRNDLGGGVVKHTADERLLAEEAVVTTICVASLLTLRLLQSVPSSAGSE